ncbi:hypothetical protein EBS80_05645 [bacterium]|nr:hypothetical protein [bacterium]
MIEIAPLSPTYEHRFVAVIVGAAVAVGALFYALVWSVGGLGVNLLLVQAAFVAATFFLARRTGHEMADEAWVPAVTSLAFAAAFALFASPFALDVALVGFLASQAVFLLYAIGHHADFHHPFTFVHTAFFLTPIHVISRIGIVRADSDGYAYLPAVRLSRPEPTTFMIVTQGAGKRFVRLMLSSSSSAQDPPLRHPWPLSSKSSSIHW